MTEPEDLLLIDNDKVYSKLKSLFMTEFEKEHNPWEYESGKIFGEKFPKWIEKNTTVESCTLNGLLGLIMLFNNEEDLVMFKLQWC